MQNTLSIGRFKLNYSNRISQLAKRLSEESIDKIILFNRANIRYYTGFRMNAASFSILIIDRDGEVCLIVPLLDYQRARRDCWIDNKSIDHFPEDTPDYLKALESSLLSNSPKKIGLEENSITHHQMSYLKELCPKSAKFNSIDQMLLKLRSIKTESELEIIRKAASIADKAMTKALEMIKEGTTEAEISAYAKYVMECEGAEGPSFEPFVMSGENAWLPQRISTKKELAEGELTVFDMGAICGGYCSDLTRTFCLGEASKEQKKIFKVAYQAQRRAIDTIKPGKKAWEIDNAAREIIENHGYGEYFPHLTGHGVGIDIHEHPILDKGVKMVLEPNMVTTVEPGIYLPEVGAARVEDMVLVTEDGSEILTQTKRSLMGI